MKRLKKIGIVLMIVVVGVLVVVAVQWWNKTQTEAMEKAAINNLMMIDGPKQQWALEHNVDSNAIPTWNDLSPYIWGDPPFCSASGYGFRMPKYPPGAIYTIRRLADSPLCSYSGRTLALYGLSIHVKDASVDDEDGELYEGYLENNKSKMRLAGSIAGASVAVEDKKGHWTNTVTDDEGMASVNTDQPVAIVVSKDGFLTISNSVQDGYEYNQVVSLQKKPN